jgi:hypothetical protein
MTSCAFFDHSSPRSRTLFAHNLDHQVELVTHPDGRTIEPVYGAGCRRLDTAVTQRSTSGYTYDRTSYNPTGISSPGGGALAFAYDGSLPLAVTLAGETAGTAAFGYSTSFEPTSRRLNGGTSPVLGYNLASQLESAGALSVALDGRNVEAFYHRAVARSGLGDTSGAYSDLRRASELDPAQIGIYREVQRLLAEEDRWADAAACWSRYLTDHPGNREAEKWRAAALTRTTSSAEDNGN